MSHENCLENSAQSHMPATVSASLDARLAPYRTRAETRDDAPAQAASARQEGQSGLRLIDDLKLLFAALGAGGSVVPMGDNSRAARLLSEYANSLRKH